MGNEDQVTGREFGALSSKVEGMDKTLTGIQTDMKSGFNKMHDTMNGLVSQKQLKDVDENVEKCHTRISNNFWKLLSLIGTLIAGAVTLAFKFLIKSSP